MKVFWCEFPAMYLGGYALIIAEDEKQALIKLQVLIENHSLKYEKDRTDIREIDVTDEKSYVFYNGDY